MELIGYPTQSRDLGLIAPAPTTNRISDHQGRSFKPYAPKEDLCLDASVFDSLVNAAVEALSRVRSTCAFPLDISHSLPHIVNDQENTYE